MGRYGFECLLLCSCANSSFCDAATGQCKCPSGRTGSDCDQGRFFVIS